jgi:hypothetical protein
VTEADAARYAQAMAERLTQAAITAGHSRQQYLGRLQQQRDYSASQPSKGQFRRGTSAIERSAMSGPGKARTSVQEPKRS